MQSNDALIYVTILLSTIIILICTFSFIFFVIRYKIKVANAYNNIEIQKINLEKDRLKIELEIQEETFLHISKEIHDNICLSLTLAKLHLNTYLINENKRIEEIENSIDILSKSLLDLHDLSKSVDGEVIKKHGLIYSLEQEIEKLRKTTKLDINENIQGELIYLEPDKELMVFRIIQESFNNIIKHSKATIVSININYTAEFFEVIIEDNGIGFNYSEAFKYKKSSGLKNIKRRSLMIESELIVTSEISKGTKLHLKLPLYKKKHEKIY